MHGVQIESSLYFERCGISLVGHVTGTNIEPVLMNGDRQILQLSTLSTSPLPLLKIGSEPRSAKSLTLLRYVIRVPHICLIYAVNGINQFAEYSINDHTISFSRSALQHGTRPPPRHLQTHHIQDIYVYWSDYHSFRQRGEGFHAKGDPAAEDPQGCS